MGRSVVSDQLASESRCSSSLPSSSTARLRRRRLRLARVGRELAVDLRALLDRQRVVVDVAFDPRGLAGSTSSRAVIEPLTRARQARGFGGDRALDRCSVSPWTSEAQTMSPSTVPSTCRSAEASISPVMATSAPITEKVEPAIGPGWLRVGAAGVGRLGLLREHAGAASRKGRGLTARSLMRTSKCRCGPVERPVLPIAPMTSPAATCWPTRARERGHVGVAGHHAVAVADFDDVAVTGLRSDESNLALGRGMDRRADRAAEIEPGMHRRAARERVAAIAEARRDHVHARPGMTCGMPVEPALERVHPREAEAEPREARIERAVARGRAAARADRPWRCGRRARSSSCGSSPSLRSAASARGGARSAKRVSRSTSASWRASMRASAPASGIAAQTLSTVCAASSRCRKLSRRPRASAGSDLDHFLEEVLARRGRRRPRR